VEFAPDRYERALVVTAHPDDVDFMFAGGVARLVEAGVDVAYLIVTDGQAGGFDRDVPREQMPTIRRAEQTAAAAALGVTDVRFLGLVDGEVAADLDLARHVSRRIREHRPDLVITTTPERNYRRVGASHPDHRAVGEATLDAVYPFARNPFAFPELLADEGLEPWVVAEVWLGGHPQPDLHVDVTDVLERKLAALRAHASQLTDPGALAGRIHEWMAATAAEGGLADGRLAEAVRVVQIEQLPREGDAD
jgi:LmbE family N-acetylglucosaminyl deacetylase